MILLKLPNGEKFPIRHQRATSERDSLVVLKPDGSYLASITWNDFTGEIGLVKVLDVDYRRKGIATALWNLANTFMTLKHSAFRTGAGDAWAHSVGGEIPPLNRN